MLGSTFTAELLRAYVDVGATCAFEFWRVKLGILTIILLTTSLKETTRTPVFRSKVNESSSGGIISINVIDTLRALSWVISSRGLPEGSRTAPRGIDKYVVFSSPKLGCSLRASASVWSRVMVSMAAVVFGCREPPPSCRKKSDELTVGPFWSDTVVTSKVEMFTASLNSKISVPSPRSRLKASSCGLLSSPVKLVTCLTALFRLRPAKSSIAVEITLRKVLFLLVARSMIPLMASRSTLEIMNSITSLIVVRLGPVVNW